jgi:CheY-like chemotaxis protein
MFNVNLKRFAPETPRSHGALGAEDKMGNILMIDDGALVTSWLSEILRREQHAVETATDERDALELYNEHLHDLIVADVRVPEGLEMFGEVLRRTPHARILAIVGSELIQPDSIVNMSNTFGFVRVLRKPFSIETFLRTVTAQLSETEF